MDQAELISCWMQKNVEGITRSIAGMTREDADELIDSLWRLIGLLTEAKEIL